MWMTEIFGTRWSTSILNFNNFEVAYLISFGRNHSWQKYENILDFWRCELWILRIHQWLREKRFTKKDLNFPHLDYLVKKLSSWLFPRPLELLQYSRSYQARHYLRKFPTSGMIFFLVIIFLVIMVWITFSCREIARVQFFSIFTMTHSNINQ